MALKAYAIVPGGIAGPVPDNVANDVNEAVQYVMLKETDQHLFKIELEEGVALVPDSVEDREYRKAARQHAEGLGYKALFRTKGPEGTGVYMRIVEKSSTEEK